MRTHRWRRNTDKQQQQQIISLINSIRSLIIKSHQLIRHLQFHNTLVYRFAFIGNLFTLSWHKKTQTHIFFLIVINDVYSRISNRNTFAVLWLVSTKKKERVVYATVIGYSVSAYSICMRRFYSPQSQHHKTQRWLLLKISSSLRCTVFFFFFSRVPFFSFSGFIQNGYITYAYDSVSIIHAQKLLLYAMTCASQPTNSRIEFNFDAISAI